MERVKTSWTYGKVDTGVRTEVAVALSDPVSFSEVGLEIGILEQWNIGIMNTGRSEYRKVGTSFHYSTIPFPRF
jgi:hypothetical protein